MYNDRQQMDMGCHCMLFVIQKFNTKVTILIFFAEYLVHRGMKVFFLKKIEL